MRAWQVHELGEPSDVLAEVNLDLPELTPSQLRVRTLAAAANFPDVLLEDRAGKRGLASVRVADQAEIDGGHFSGSPMGSERGCARALG